MGLFHKKTSTQPIQSQLVNFLKGIHFNHSIVEENETRTVIRVGVVLSIGNCDSFFVINHNLKLVEFMVHTPQLVPENKRSEVAKFLNLADYHTFIGNLQMDHRDGTVRCKTHFVYDDENLNQKIIESNFYAGYNMVERYFPGIMRITYGNKDAESAFKEVNEIINPLDN